MLYFWRGCRGNLKLITLIPCSKRPRDSELRERLPHVHPAGLWSPTRNHVEQGGLIEVAEAWWLIATGWGAMLQAVSLPRATNFKLPSGFEVATDTVANATKLVRPATSLKPWPNGAPNSSQIEPSYKIKTCIGVWPNYTAKSSKLARNHSNCLNTSESWLGLAEVPKQRKTWLELGENLSLIKFKPTRANSSKWVAKRYPTPSKLWTWLELAWVGRTVWLGLNFSSSRQIGD